MTDRMPRYLLWFLLAVPGFVMVYRLAVGAPPADLLHGSGESSARMMIIALLLTPLRTIFPKARWLMWLRSQRRAFGLAAFGFAVLHTAFYLMDMGQLKYVLAEITTLGIWTGWVAFLIFIPLAVTSTDRSVQRLGPKWTPLHRSVYIAAVLTLVHWIYVHDNAVPAWVHFAPLLVLEAIRIFIQTSRQNSSQERRTNA